MVDRRSGSPSRNELLPEPLAGEALHDTMQSPSHSDGITPARLVRSVRENRPLFLVITGIMLGVSAFLLATDERMYSARSVIRMASERRMMTSQVENAPQTVDRAIDPLLSAVQVLTSRTLVGSVVDSLGLRFRPVSPFTLGAPLIGRRLSPGAIHSVFVVPDAPADTFGLFFSDDGVVVRSRGDEASADYGSRLELGSLSLAVPERPVVDYATAVIDPRDMAIDAALQRLKVVPRPGTDVIDVKYLDSDPVRAQRFANQLAVLFRAANGHSAQEQARRRREFLGDQLTVTDSLLVLAERELSTFRGDQQLGSSTENLTAEQASSSARRTRHGELAADREVLDALLGQFKNADEEGREARFQALAYSPEVASDPILGQLQQRLIGYRNRLDSLTSGPWRALPSHPDVVQLATLVDSTQDQLVRAVRARLASIDARLAVLSNQQANGQRSISDLPAQQAAEATLDRRVQVLRTTTDGLRQEYQKARISEALGAADIEILDLAPLPYRPSGVPRSATLMFGLLLGMLFGSGAAIMADATNSSVRRPKELHDLIGATELGTIPRINGIISAPANHRRLLESGSMNGDKGGLPSEILFSPSGALSSEAEAFRMLRMSLAFSWGDRPCTLVVTSAGPQEGKTLIAANLAATFARGGASVLLIDCDIHRPRLHRVFHSTRTPGLMDLLRGGATAISTRLKDAAIRKTSIDRLSFLPCGTDPHTSPELLEPATLRGLLSQLRQGYDVILVDTPPVLVSADAATLGASADGVIMVIRAGQTDRGAAELAGQRVAAAGGRVLGAVLNDPDGVLARLGEPSYAYSYPATVD